MKIVVFTLNDREYALDVAQVREVIRITTILPLPDVPSWIEGIINLRGEILPILSLPRKLNIGTQNQNDLNRVIIAHRQERCFGILVDSVLGVKTISKKDLCIPDELLRETGTIQAVAKIDHQMIPLLDLYSLLNESETQTLQGASQQSEAVLYGSENMDCTMVQQEE